MQNQRLVACIHAGLSFEVAILFGTYPMKISIHHLGMDEICDSFRFFRYSVKYQLIRSKANNSKREICAISNICTKWSFPRITQPYAEYLFVNEFMYIRIANQIETKPF